MHQVAHVVLVELEIRREVLLNRKSPVVSEGRGVTTKGVLASSGIKEMGALQLDTYDVARKRA